MKPSFKHLVARQACPVLRRRACPELCRRGFTLIEIIVVISIIIVILASLVPVIGTLANNNGEAGAQNQIAAALGNARSDALYFHIPTGVFFWVDRNTGRVAMTEVQADAQLTGGYLYLPNSATYGTDAGGTETPGAAQSNGQVNALELVNYFDSTSGKYVFYRDTTLLPTGIGIALYNNFYGYNDYTKSPGFDRYVRLGAIMFDANGTLTSMPFAVPARRNTPNYSGVTQLTPADSLGAKLGLKVPTDPSPTGDLCSIIGTPAQAPPNPPASTKYPLNSQVGLIIYNRTAFSNKRTALNYQFSDYDWSYRLPNQPQTGVDTMAPQDKLEEEQWLDQNGTALLVSQFNGELIKAK